MFLYKRNNTKAHYIGFTEAFTNPKTASKYFSTFFFVNLNICNFSKIFQKTHAIKTV